MKRSNLKTQIFLSEVIGVQTRLKTRIIEMNTYVALGCANKQLFAQSLNTVLVSLWQWNCWCPAHAAIFVILKDRQSRCHAPGMTLCDWSGVWRCKSKTGSDFLPQMLFFEWECLWGETDWMCTLLSVFVQFTALRQQRYVSPLHVAIHNKCKQFSLYTMCHFKHTKTLTYQPSHKWTSCLSVCFGVCLWQLIKVKLMEV